MSNSQPLAPTFDQMVSLQAEDYFRRGLDLQNQGLLEEAHQDYQACLRLQSAHYQALNNLGNVQRELGQVNEALVNFDLAIACNPQNFLAHYNRAILLDQSGLKEAALQSYMQCLNLKPDFAEAWCNCGLILLDIQKFPDAVRCLETAIRFKPDFFLAFNNLGIAHMRLRQWNAALLSFESAIQLNLQFPEAFVNLGLVLSELQQNDAAQIAFRQAVALRPGYGRALLNAYGKAMHICDWTHRNEDEAGLIKLVQRGEPDIAVMSLLTIDKPLNGASGAFLRQATELYASARYPELKLTPLGNTARRKADGRLRIGYLSADYHEHATMYLLQGVLDAHDHCQFEIYGYSYGAVPRRLTDKTQASFDMLRDVQNLSNSEAAYTISNGSIDILIDLKGFTGENRLEITAHRPAPVIVNWLGYPGTFGHPLLADYIIGDPVVTPPEHAEHFSETLALMPHCYQPNDSQRQIGPKPSRAEMGLPEDAFVFCNFNQSYKFDQESFALWCQLLREVPGSVLWLQAPNEYVAARLRDLSQGNGIEPQRLVFAEWADHTQHLGRLQIADLALDTYPVVSHTTASDALWAGVPLVSRMGESFVSRVAASLLITVGLPDLVADSPQAYFEIAKDLALNPTRLQDVRRRLKTGVQNSPLFDTQQFTRNLEKLYQAIWSQHLLGERKLIKI